MTEGKTNFHMKIKLPSKIGKGNVWRAVERCLTDIVQRFQNRGGYM
jgi:hypothetical protein